MIILTALLPILFLKKLAAIGKFSLVILTFTLVAIIIMLYLSIVILYMSVDEANKTYGLHLTEADRDYKLFDGMMVPVFSGAMMSLLDGNQQILNIYSEADKSQNFFLTTFNCMLACTVFGATVGYIGYLAFGNTVKGVILYSLPNDDPAAFIAKICYVLTIMGSIVLSIQPIFYVMESSNWYKKTSKCCMVDDTKEKMPPKAAQDKLEADDSKPRDCQRAKGEESTGDEEKAEVTKIGMNMS